jgi:CRISPR-associated endonuclease/helicase Cas3
MTARTGVCLAALHDVGKVTPGFQRKCTPWLACHGLSAADLAGEEDHAKVSQKTLQDLLGEDSPRRFWAAIVGAHHGRLKGEHLTPLSCSHDGGAPWTAERRRLVEALVTEFGPLPSEPPPGPEPWDSPALWFNAGLIAVADWLASDERTFPPSKALTRAELEARSLRQLHTIGLRPLALPAGRGFAALFGFSPLPLQVATAGSASAPGIFGDVPCSAWRTPPPSLPPIRS